MHACRTGKSLHIPAAEDPSCPAAISRTPTHSHRYGGTAEENISVCPVALLEHSVRAPSLHTDLPAGHTPCPQRPELATSAHTCFHLGRAQRSQETAQLHLKSLPEFKEGHGGLGSDGAMLHPTHSRGSVGAQSTRRCSCSQHRALHSPLGLAAPSCLLRLQKLL